ncbi:MAG: hypothetical protein HYT37_02295 [Candidatus Sungbacteria bacterium]|nr:hypothetical protein [Candidatus Sungbacteria bacterium]
MLPASAVVLGFTVLNFRWALLFSVLLTIISGTVSWLETSYE